MGASKALAEWAVEGAQARYPNTRYATVRFGNVLGSSGSVVPIFRRQIAAGGPVTVTDPKMTRYFMTIPEAVQLIIRAGSLPADSGAVFVLDMGDAVAIRELAEQMIRLSGLEPEKDIAIDAVARSSPWRRRARSSAWASGPAGRPSAPRSWRSRRLAAPAPRPRPSSRPSP